MGSNLPFERARCYISVLAGVAALFCSCNKHFMASKSNLLKRRSSMYDVVYFVSILIFGLVVISVICPALPPGANPHTLACVISMHLFPVLCTAAVEEYCPHDSKIKRRLLFLVWVMANGLGFLTAYELAAMNLGHPWLGWALTTFLCVMSFFSCFVYPDEKPAQPESKDQCSEPSVALHECASQPLL